MLKNLWGVIPPPLCTGRVNGLSIVAVLSFGLGLALISVTHLQLLILPFFLGGAFLFSIFVAFKGPCWAKVSISSLSSMSMVKIQTCGAIGKSRFQVTLGTSGSPAEKTYPTHKSKAERCYTPLHSRKQVIEL